MKRNNILFCLFGLWLLTTAIPMQVWSGEIWFNYPQNDAAFYTNGPTTIDIYVSWNRILTPNYYGEVIKIQFDGVWIPDNTPPPIWRTESLGQHTYHAELWEYDIAGRLVKTAESTISFSIHQYLQIYTLSPSTAIAGGPGFTLTVSGTGFVPRSVVRWNGSNRTTTFIHGGQVQASISASDIATIGAASVVVHTPPVGIGTPANGGTSNALIFTINPATITLDQQRQDGTRLSGSIIGRWNGSSFDSITVTTPPPTISTIIGAREVLRGKQDTISDPTEKYRVWERNFTPQLDTVQNHRGFTIRPDDASFTSRFHPTDPTVTIKTDLIDLPGTTGGNIQFKDPWYIDHQDPQYGYNWRNRGMQGAVYWSRPSPFTPSFTDTFPETPHPYRGVFLNQGLTPQGQWVPPYYSVGAPRVNTIGGYPAYFQNWTGTNVTYRSANKDTSAIVFTASNATATTLFCDFSSLFS